MTDEQQYRHVRSVKQKHRYRTDPDYRESMKAKASAYYHRKKLLGAQ